MAKYAGLIRYFRYSWFVQVGQVGEVGLSSIAVGDRHLLTCRHNLQPIDFITAPDADPTQPPERPRFSIQVAGQRRQAQVLEAGDGQEWVDDWALLQLNPTDARGEQADAGAGGAGWRIGEPVVGEGVIIVGYPAAAAGELVVLTAEVAHVRPDGSFELKLSTDSQHQVDAYSTSLRGMSGGAVLQADPDEGRPTLLGMARGDERTHVFGITLKRRLIAIPIPSPVIELEAERSMGDPEP